MSFDEFAPRYDASLHGNPAADPQWILDALTLTGDEAALDAAAGTAQVAKALAPHVRTVIALDTSAAMLEHGRHPHVIAMRGDVEELPFADATFDVVTIRFALHHLDDPAAALAGLARVTKPGGRLVIVDFESLRDLAALAGTVTGVDIRANFARVSVTR